MGEGEIARLAAWGQWLHPDAPHLLMEAGVHVVDMAGHGLDSIVDSGIDALYVRSPNVVTATVLDGLPGLRVIAVAGAGTEIVDLDAATERGIPVIHGRGHGAAAVAEWTVGAALWLVRDVARLHNAVREAQWTTRHEVAARRDLASLVVGVCGFGHIGERVARAITAGFDGTVIVNEPDARRADAARTAGLDVVPLDVLLQRSDVVTVHAGAELGAPPLLGRRQLELLQRTAVIINTSRGQLLDLDVLADLLDEGRLAGAALDVFDPEPPGPVIISRLLAHPRVLLSPHAAGMTADAVRALARGVATDIVRTLQGGRPQSCANPEVCA